MIEQVELDFTIKAEISVMQDLVEILNENHLVEILTITDGSTDRKLAGPVFLFVAASTNSSERWEYKIATPPTVYASKEDIESWLNNLGNEGYQVLNLPKKDDQWWFFKRKLQ